MAKIKFNTVKVKRKKWCLRGGPFDGHILFSSDGSTFTFGLGEFYGRYEFSLWVEVPK